LLNYTIWGYHITFVFYLSATVCVLKLNYLHPVGLLLFIIFFKSLTLTCEHTRQKSSVHVVGIPWGIIFATEFGCKRSRNAGDTCSIAPQVMQQLAIRVALKICIWFLWSRHD